MREQAKPPGDRLEAVAEWFTEAKNLWLERLPVGLITDLRAGAAALREQAWQPITSARTDARKGLSVLVSDGTHVWESTHRNPGGWSRSPQARAAGVPTHWRSLPLPPAGPQEPR